MLFDVGPHLLRPVVGIWERVIPLSQPVVMRALKCLSPLQKGSVCLFLRHCVFLHFLHGPLLKLVALSNLLGVHGLFRSFVVAFLAVAVRSNSGLRTAIIRMLVFHRSTSALPVHWWPPARCGFYTRLLLKNDLLSSPRMIPAVGEARERESGIVDQWRSTKTCAETVSVGSVLSA